MSWHEVAPAGRIYSWTRVWQPFLGNEDLPLPSVNLLVELPQAGGIRLLGLLAGGAAASVQTDPRIGQPVSGQFARREGARPLPILAWSVAEGSPA